MDLAQHTSLAIPAAPTGPPPQRQVQRPSLVFERGLLTLLGKSEARPTVATKESVAEWREVIEFQVSGIGQALAGQWFKGRGGFHSDGHRHQPPEEHGWLGLSESFGDQQWERRQRRYLELSGQIPGGLKSTWITWHAVQSGGLSHHLHRPQVSFLTMARAASLQEQIAGASEDELRKVFESLSEADHSKFLSAMAAASWTDGFGVCACFASKDPAETAKLVLADAKIQVKEEVGAPWVTVMGHPREAPEAEKDRLFWVAAFHSKEAYHTEHTSRHKTFVSELMATCATGNPLVDMNGTYRGAMYYMEKPEQNNPGTVYVALSTWNTKDAESAQKLLDILKIDAAKFMQTEAELLQCVLFPTALLGGDLPDGVPRDDRMVKMVQVFKSDALKTVQSMTSADKWKDLMEDPVKDYMVLETVDVVLFFHTLFSCVGYVTMIGDFCIKSASGLMPDSIFARRRESSILVISLFAIFPLCFCVAWQNLDPLKYTSVVGLAITAVSCAYIFYDVIANAEEYGAVQLDMFKTLALFNGSFSAHYNAPTYYAELKEKTFFNYMKVSFYAFGIATLLFTAFGLAGFARFGDEAP
eukprot:s22_g31.t1